MNHKERFLAVFSEDQALDRVPTFVQGIKGEFIAKHEEQLFADDSLDLTFNPEFDACQVLGFDGKFSGLPSPVGHDPVQLPDVDGTLHAVGLGATVGKEGSSFYHQGLLHSLESLELLRSAVKYTDAADRIKQEMAYHDSLREHIFPVTFMGGIFDTMWMAMGMKDFGRNYNKRTPLYLETIRFYGEIMAKNVEAIIDAVGNAPGVICIGDDVAFKGHPMIAPDRWEQDIGPYYKTVCDMMRDAGIVPLMHTDGDITDIVPAFQRVGIRGVQGWEGGADPQYINDHFPDFYVIGFGDVGEVLPFGTPDQIDAHVKKLMDALKENRHYIFGPSTVIVKEMPLENVQRFMAAGLKYGQY
jgi:hypothetical protein